jgi:hypothetical protein
MKLRVQKTSRASYLEEICDPYCNTPGVYHSLSSGFELKHNGLSGDDNVKVNHRDEPNLKLDVAPLLYI